jgi:hypothetical protein
MSSIVQPQSRDEIADTFDHLALVRKHRLTKPTLPPGVERMAKLDPPPKGLQSPQAGRPAISVPGGIIEVPAASASPSASACVVQHAAPSATAADKFGPGELAADAFVTHECDSLVAVNHNPVRRRLDRDREPRAGPA